MWLKWLYDYVYTAVYQIGVGKIFFQFGVSKINAFIKQGCIKLVKSDSKDVYTLYK